MTASKKVETSVLQLQGDAFCIQSKGFHLVMRTQFWPIPGFQSGLTARMIIFHLNFKCTLSLIYYISTYKSFSSSYLVSASIKQCSMIIKNMYPVIRILEVTFQLCSASGIKFCKPWFIFLCSTTIQGSEGEIRCLCKVFTWASGACKVCNMLYIF